MKKFIVQKAVGNHYTTIGMYEHKKDALQAGERFFRGTAERCRVVCIRAEVDIDGHIDRLKYELYNLWW